RVEGIALQAGLRIALSGFLQRRQEGPALAGVLVVARHRSAQGGQAAIGRAAIVMWQDGGAGCRELRRFLALLVEAAQALARALAVIAQHDDTSALRLHLAAILLGGREARQAVPVAECNARVVVRSHQRAGGLRADLAVRRQGLSELA